MTSAVAVRSTAAILLGLVVLGSGCDLHGSGRVTTALTSEAGACVVAKHRFSVGPVTFEVQNNGARAASYEVRDEGGDGRFTRRVASVHGVAPGDSARMTATLEAGQYQVRCLPDSGRSRGVIVRAEADTSIGGGVENGPQRTFRFTVSKTSAVDPPPPMRAKVGDLVTFALDNRSDQSVELVVRGPHDEESLALSADPRKSEESNVVLGSVFTYTVHVDGHGGTRFPVHVSP